MIATSRDSLYKLIPPKNTEMFEQAVIHSYLLALPKESWLETNQHKQMNPIPELLTDIMIKQMGHYVNGVLWLEYEDEDFLQKNINGFQPEAQQDIIDRFTNDCLHPSKNEFKNWFFADVLTCLERLNLTYRLRHMNGSPWDLEAEIMYETLHNPVFVRVW